MTQEERTYTEEIDTEDMEGTDALLEEQAPKMENESGADPDNASPGQAEDEGTLDEDTIDEEDIDEAPIDLGMVYGAPETEESKTEAAEQLERMSSAIDAQFTEDTPDGGNEKEQEAPSAQERTGRRQRRRRIIPYNGRELQTQTSQAQRRETMSRWTMYARNRKVQSGTVLKYKMGQVTAGDTTTTLPILYLSTSDGVTVKIPVNHYTRHRITEGISPEVLRNWSPAEHMQNLRSVAAHRLGNKEVEFFVTRFDPETMEAYGDRVPYLDMKKQATFGQRRGRTGTVDGTVVEVKVIYVTTNHLCVEYGGVEKSLGFAEVTGRRSYGTTMAEYLIKAYNLRDEDTGLPITAADIPNRTFLAVVHVLRDDDGNFVDATFNLAEAKSIQAMDIFASQLDRGDRVNVTITNISPNGSIFGVICDTDLPVLLISRNSNTRIVVGKRYTADISNRPSISDETGQWLIRARLGSMIPG